jgi:hypothetical protein
MAGRIEKSLYNVLIIYYLYYFIKFIKIEGIKMKKPLKKTIAVFMCLIFLFSAVATSTAVTINKQKLEEPEAEESIQKITLIRYGLDGSETPFDICLELEEGQDYIDAVIEKCNELLEEDAEINNYFNSLDEDENQNESALKFGYNAKVISWGRGFHFKTRWKFKIVLMNRLFGLFLPWNRFQLHRPWVICNYRNDSKAKTIINAKNVNETIVINGSHMVIMNQFFGFALWPGKFEKSPFDILPRLIVGKARFIVTYKK